MNCIDLNLGIVYYESIGPLVKTHKEDFSFQCFHLEGEVLVLACLYNDKCNWDPVSSLSKTMSI